MMGNDWYGMSGWMASGWLWMTLATIAIVLLVVWAMRGLGDSAGSRGSASGGQNRSAALDALDLRFAKGEIGEEEYRSMRRTLTGA